MYVLNKLKITIVLNETPCSLVGRYTIPTVWNKSADPTVYPEDEGSKFLRNDTHLPDYGVSSHKHRYHN
jgi:hypothetical protein